MTLSMTGFSNLSQTFSYGCLTWEIRSVNHRYLEVDIQTQTEFKGLITDFKNKFKDKLSRGKIYASFTLDGSLSDNTLSINQIVLNQLNQVKLEINQKLDQDSELPLDFILEYPGILSEKKLDLDQVKKDATVVLEKALEHFISSREKEGKALKTILCEKLEQIKIHLNKIIKIAPVSYENYKKRLNDRLNKEMDSIDENRLMQELVYLAQKMDITEETDRLNQHLLTINDIFKTGGVIGRRLDFMMQELNRETNTIQSKSTDAILTQEAVEIKVLIEQMREQVQNIE